MRALKGKENLKRAPHVARLTRTQINACRAHDLSVHMQVERPVALIAGRNGLRCGFRGTDCGGARQFCKNSALDSVKLSNTQQKHCFYSRFLQSSSSPKARQIAYRPAAIGGCSRLAG